MSVSNTTMSVRSARRVLIELGSVARMTRMQRSFANSALLRAGLPSLDGEPNFVAYLGVLNAATYAKYEAFMKIA